MADTATEGQIIQRESGGKPYVGYTGVDLSNAPLDPYGFPIWSGQMGPQGISHAAGLYQFEPGTWREGAAVTGVSDFSPESQKKVFDYIHGKYGNEPWAASATGYQEGYGVGEQRHGGTYVGVVRPEEGITPEGAALLSSILQQHYPSEDKSTGNELLDGIMQGHVFGQAEPQPQPALDTRALQAATPPAQAPETVPELAKPVQTAPLQPMPQPALPEPQPAAPPIAAPQQPTPQPPIQAAPAPRPIIQPDSRVAEASMIPQGLLDTGNALLNKILSSAPRLTAPRGGASLIGNLLGQPAAIPRAVPSPSTGSAAMDRRHAPDIEPSLAQRAGSALRQDLWDLVTGPFTSGGEQVKRAMTTGEMPIPEQAVGDVLPVVGGSVVRPPGSLGAGIGLPARLPPRVPGAEVGPAVTPRASEPPPLRTDIPRIGQSTDVRPFAEGGGPPAIPPTGVSRVPGAEPPPEGPGMFRDVRATVDQPRPPKGDANESGPVKQMRLQAMHSTQDQLFKLWSQGNAYINKMLRQFAKMPRLSAEENLQVERYLERQEGMPQVAITPRARRIADEVIKPSREIAAEDWKWLRDHDADEHLSPEHVEDLTEGEDITEGYLHRMRAPTGGERHPFDPFAGRRSLRQSTSSMQGRKWYVVQDMSGNRTIYRGDAPPPNTPIYQDPAGGATFQSGPENNPYRKIGEVRRATTEEVEANTDTRYVHDPVLASLQNMAQLHLARKNVELLRDKLLPELHDQGLETTDRRAATRFSTVPGRPWRETQVPALRGHYFEPRVADAFDDYYRTPSLLSEDLRGLTGLFSAINRTAINTLFLNPFGHMRNVTADALLARGHLWFDPLSYPGFAQTMKAAFNDVWKRSPFYYQVMNAGGSTMGASFENRILYQTLADRAKFEMTRLPHFEEVARATGVWPTAKAMGEAIWNASQKLMWGFHDMLLLQRVREEMLRNPKLSMEQAVQQAERFIADYRVPATIEGGRLSLPQAQARSLSRLMQDRSVTVFGRYHYNKLKAIANTIRDVDRALTQGGIPASQRLQAAGRLGAMLVWSNIIMYGLTSALRAVSGNPNAQVHVPGTLGIPANAQKAAQDLMKGQLGQAGWDFWMGLMSTITPIPALMEAGEQIFNRAYPGGPEIRGTQLPAGKQLIQSGTHFGRSILPPVGDVLDWRRGLESTFGLKLPPPTARPPGTPYFNRRDLRRQSRAFARQFPGLSIPSDAYTYSGMPDEGTR